MPDSPNQVEEVEPDYRFTLANERTYLSWIRTSLALIAGGIALAALQTLLPSELRLIREIGILATILGGILPIISLQHWRKVQQAMRRGEPLPVQRAAIVVAIGLVALAAGLSLVILQSLPE